MTSGLSFTIQITDEQFKRVEEVFKDHGAEINEDGTGELVGKDIADLKWAYHQGTLTVTVTKGNTLKVKFAPNSMVQADITEMLQKFLLSAPEETHVAATHVALVPSTLTPPMTPLFPVKGAEAAQVHMEEQSKTDGGEQETGADKSEGNDEKQDEQTGS